MIKSAGGLRAKQGKLHLSSATTLLSLWRHECERVFCDKLTNNKDKVRATVLWKSHAWTTRG
jgi:dynein heavy chain